MDRQLPRANQGRSRLLSLPAEIRLRILQELLVVDAPIRERHETGRGHIITLPGGRRRDRNGRFITNTRTIPERGYGISSQILRTSQSLNKEGLPELYSRNVLRLDITAGNYAGPALTRQQICNLNNPNCTNCLVLTTLDDEVLARRVCSSQLTIDAQVLRLANRFQKILITVRAEGDTLTRMAIRQCLSFINRSLLNKDVEVDIWFPTPIDDRDFIKYVHVFRVLRCPTFKFVHLNRQNPIHSEVEREVMSTLPIVDLIPAYNDLGPLARVLEGEMQAQSRHVEVAEVRRMLTELVETMETFDVDGFRRCSTELRDMFMREMGVLMARARVRDTELERLQRARQN